MTSIKILLSFANQTVSCNAAGPQRNITFLGTRPGDDELRVTRGSRDFDARKSRWIVMVFDSQEQPLTEFYVERAAARNIEWLAGALYLQPNEYAESEQPEITVYVWLPPSIFNSIWNVAPIMQSAYLQATLSLTAPFRGSALNYSLGAPDRFDKVWRAEDENPLLIEGSEFYISPIKR